MPTQSNIHFYVNWAKERLDEMDAGLTSLEAKAAECRPTPATRPTKHSPTCAKTVMGSGSHQDAGGSQRGRMDQRKGKTGT